MVVVEIRFILFLIKESSHNNIAFINLSSAPLDKLVCLLCIFVRREFFKLEFKFLCCFRIIDSYQQFPLISFVSWNLLWDPVSVQYSVTLERRLSTVASLPRGQSPLYARWDVEKHIEVCPICHSRDECWHWSERKNQWGEDQHAINSLLSSYHFNDLSNNYNMLFIYH